MKCKTEFIRGDEQKVAHQYQCCFEGVAWCSTSSHKHFLSTYLVYYGHQNLKLEQLYYTGKKHHVACYFDLGYTFFYRDSVATDMQTPQMWAKTSK